ncbi:MAG: MarR family transcriptional regulator [Chloroflexota bacterium]
MEGLPDKREETLGLVDLDGAMSVLTCAHRLRTMLNDYARQSVGLTIERVSALCVIDLAKSLTIGQLAANLSRTENATTTLTARLASQGLVQRQRVLEGDGREVRVTLTGSAQIALVQFRSGLSAFYKSIISSPDTDVLLELIETARGFREEIANL